MKMKKVFAGLAVALTMATTPVFAENSGYYVEAAYDAINATDKSSDDLGTFSPAAVKLTFGKAVTDNLAVEGFISQGVSTGTATKSSTDFTIELKTGYGLAVKPFMKLGEDLEVYGRLGWAQINATFSYSSVSGDINTGYFLASVGLAYKITNNISATLDYTGYTRRNDIDVNATSIGVRYSF